MPNQDQEIVKQLASIKYAVWICAFGAVAAVLSAIISVTDTRLFFWHH